eukprot:6199945-Pleurochrysis_carterae.AAC.1
MGRDAAASTAYAHGGGASTAEPGDRPASAPSAVGNGECARQAHRSVSHTLVASTACAHGDGASTAEPGDGPASASSVGGDGECERQARGSASHALAASTACAHGGGADQRRAWGWAGERAAR